MKEFHFKRYLTQTSLDDIASKYHLRNTAGIEKYIMDFELLFHILKVLPDCTVKGGMAVPFHVSGGLRRLSEDIDMVTHHTKEETENAIEGLRKDLEPLVDMRLYVPKKPRRRLPLLTYWCRYRSHIADSQIKLEIFYGAKGTIPIKTFDSGFELMGFPIDFPVQAYDHAPLIVDKLTTLAFNTIGIPEPRKNDIPKQIYDIASLLKSFRGVFHMDEMVDLLAEISNDEIGYGQEKYSFEDILADLDKFSDLIVDSKLKLSSSGEGHLGTFKTSLLTSSYTRTAYATDILLIRLLVTLIRNVADKTQKPQLAEITMDKVLTWLKDPSNSGPNNKRWRRETLSKYDDQERAQIAQFTYQQLYLYDCILDQSVVSVHVI